MLQEQTSKTKNECHEISKTGTDQDLLASEHTELQVPSLAKENMETKLKPCTFLMIRSRTNLIISESKAWNCKEMMVKLDLV